VRIVMNFAKESIHYAKFFK